MVTLYRTNTNEPDAMRYDSDDSKNQIAMRVLELLVSDGVEIKGLAVLDDSIWVKFIRPSKSAKFAIDIKEEGLTLPKPNDDSIWYVFFCSETKGYVCCEEEELFKYNLSIHNPHI